MSKPRAQNRGSRTEPRPPPAYSSGVERGADPSPRPVDPAASARLSPSGPLAAALALRSKGDVRQARLRLEEIAGGGGPDADQARETARALGIDPGALLGALAVGAVIALATWAGILLRR